jgi:hypothetical protein
MQNIQCKIGTGPSKTMKVWESGDLSVGQKITAMPLDVYKELHWSYRRLKYCNSWENYFIDSIGIVYFLSR